mgnify:CR=1 FL=1
MKGLYIGMGEQLDAICALQKLDIRDEDAFRITLRITLAKSKKEQDIFDKFFYKSLLHHAVVMEIFCNNDLGGISYEKLCLNIPKSLGSRSSIQNLLNEGLDKKILKKVENNQDRRVKKYFLTEEFYEKKVNWIKNQKNIFNS